MQAEIDMYMGMMKELQGENAKLKEDKVKLSSECENLKSQL